MIYNILFLKSILDDYRVDNQLKKYEYIIQLTAKIIILLCKQ